MAEYDGQQSLHRTVQIRVGRDTGEIQEERLTKFICGASKPDMVKKMLSDIEQRDSFFWLEMLTGTFQYNTFGESTLSVLATDLATQRALQI